MIEQTEQSTGAADAPGIEAPQVEKLNHADKLAAALLDIRDAMDDPYAVEGVKTLNSDAIKLTERVYSVARAALAAWEAA